jgi:hypothetical protein
MKLELILTGFCFWTYSSYVAKHDRCDVIRLCVIFINLVKRSGWKLTNSAFCRQSALMCFIRISKQTEINSLYIINWLGVITETESVHCAVRTGSLKTTLCFVTAGLIGLCFKKLMWMKCGVTARLPFLCSHVSYIDLMNPRSWRDASAI